MVPEVRDPEEEGRQGLGWALRSGSSGVAEHDAGDRSQDVPEHRSGYRSQQGDGTEGDGSSDESLQGRSHRSRRRGLVLVQAYLPQQQDDWEPFQRLADEEDRQSARHQGARQPDDLS